MLFNYKNYISCFDLPLPDSGWEQGHFHPRGGRAKHPGSQGGQYSQEGGHC